MTIEYNNLINELNEIGKSIADEYKYKLDMGDVYASGTLYDSIGYKIIKTVDGFQIVFLADDYYINIENGRVAGAKMPPISVIQRWIIEKNIPDKPGLAYIIARSIGIIGIRPKPYLRDIEEELDKYTKGIEKAIINDIKEVVTTLTQNMQWQSLS